jgi:cation-transporting ATPase 13A2
LWSLDDYYYYAFCIALISALSITTTLIDTKRVSIAFSGKSSYTNVTQTIARMREMSKFSCSVSVLANGQCKDSVISGHSFLLRRYIGVEKDSTELVPGDIVNLSSSALAVVPADLFLLGGDAIVNESMLTGESVPVSKMPVPDSVLSAWKDSQDVSGEASKSFLYSGTRVVRIRGQVATDVAASTPATALVVRIGFNTTKGALVRSMLFPKPMGFKFYRDSIRFILVLTGIALLGFCASAVQFVRLGVPWHIIMLRALDLITVVVPPALPATLSIGTSFALARLREKGVFCIAPSRVNVAGKVNVCCFDKTGTLTEDGLDILGVRTHGSNTGHGNGNGQPSQFGELLGDVRDIPAGSGKDRAKFLYALATCHSLKMVDGEAIGDPLDVKMFEFTKWALEEGTVAGTGMIKDKATGSRPAALVQTVVRPPGGGAFRVEDALRGNERVRISSISVGRCLMLMSTQRAHFLELGVIRTFEFVSALRRMSVVVKRLKSTSMEIYVKGAPEVMIDICDKDSRRLLSYRGDLV